LNFYHGNNHKNCRPLDISLKKEESIIISMENAFTIVIWFLAILSVLGIIGILIEPLLRDKELPQT
jgi:acyl-coenzyme A synthetase/AMP-(fatty) acid ligase